MIHLVETTLQIGIKEPFSVWHMSDTHLTKADARENERKQTLARERTATYLRVRADSAEELLADATRICSETKLPLLYTGDLIDFTSAANFESGRDFIRATDCLFAVGNHEFSQYVGVAWEDEAYKAVSADGVREMLGCDYSVVTRVISGVNFVAIDNNYYRFTEAQHRRLREEVEKGLPVVLLLHNPLYEETLYRTMMQRSDLRVFGGNATRADALLFRVPLQAAACGRTDPCDRSLHRDRGTHPRGDRRAFAL